MEYERIHQVQTGIISPSKLRMKLMGPHHGRKKGGSNSNSSRTSPVKLRDTEFVKNSLLASKSGDFDDEVATPSLEVGTFNLASEDAPDCNHGSNMPVLPKESLQKENGNAGRAKMQQFSKSESSNSSAIHPMRTVEDENLDYDSNASSSSFEFHKERSAHSQFTRSFSRHMIPSKWNDAEKWINRQSHQPNYPKKNHPQNQANRMAVTNMVRVAPESANYDAKSLVSKVTDTRRQDFTQPASQMVFDKFSFSSSGTHLVPGQTYGGNTLIDQCTQSKDLLEIDQRELHCTRTSGDDTAVVPVIRSVCMRDMGTEMTPATSLEPSRTATPIDATTPLRSPTSSIPSTPRGGAPTSTPLEHFPDAETQNVAENVKKDLTERELKQKTRREILALGMRLGKMNIAAWASKDDQDKKSSLERTDIVELERIEFEKRASAWEEAEKSKHMARCKREEIKIQAWESQQKARLEAEMRRIEAQVEQMRAHAQAKLVKKISMARQRSDEKRSAAETRKNRDAEQTAAKAEYIRQTGRIPSSSFICCGW